MIDDSSCLLCHNHQEDVLHALWHCPTLSQVWEGDPQWSFRGQTCFGTFQELLSHVIQIGCNVELFAMLVWTIWCRRNTIRVNPTGFPLDQVLQRAIDYLLEFRATQPRNNQPHLDHWPNGLHRLRNITRLILMGQSLEMKKKQV